MKTLQINSGPDDILFIEGKFDRFGELAISIEDAGERRKIIYLKREQIIQIKNHLISILNEKL